MNDSFSSLCICMRCCSKVSIELNAGQFESDADYFGKFCTRKCNRGFHTSINVLACDYHKKLHVERRDFEQTKIEDMLKGSIEYGTVSFKLCGGSSDL